MEFASYIFWFCVLRGDPGRRTKYRLKNKKKKSNGTKSLTVALGKSKILVFRFSIGTLKEKEGIHIN